MSGSRPDIFGRYQEHSDDHMPYLRRQLGIDLWQIRLIRETYQEDLRKAYLYELRNGHLPRNNKIIIHLTSCLIDAGNDACQYAEALNNLDVEDSTWAEVLAIGDAIHHYRRLSKKLREEARALIFDADSIKMVG